MNLQTHVPIGEMFFGWIMNSSAPETTIHSIGRNGFSMNFSIRGSSAWLPRTHMVRVTALDISRSVCAIQRHVGGQRDVSTPTLYYTMVLESKDGFERLPLPVAWPSPCQTWILRLLSGCPSGSSSAPAPAPPPCAPASCWSRPCRQAGCYPPANVSDPTPPPGAVSGALPGRRRTPCTGAQKPVENEWLESYSSLEVWRLRPKPKGLFTKERITFRKLFQIMILTLSWFEAWFYSLWMQSSFKSGFEMRKLAFWIMIRLESLILRTCEGKALSDRDSDLFLIWKLFQIWFQIRLLKCKKGAF